MSVFLLQEGQIAFGIEPVLPFLVEDDAKTLLEREVLLLGPAGLADLDVDQLDAPQPAPAEQRAADLRPGEVHVVHAGVVEVHLREAGAAEAHALEACSGEVLLPNSVMGITLGPVPDVLLPVHLMIA